MSQEPTQVGIQLVTSLALITRLRLKKLPETNTLACYSKTIIAVQGALAFGRKLFWQKKFSQKSYSANNKRRGHGLVNEAATKLSKLTVYVVQPPSMIFWINYQWVV
jgi:hypothetical protein